MKYIVPFIIDSHDFMEEIEGVVKLEKNILTLEYLSKDTVFGKVTSEPKIIEIPISEVVEGVFKSNIFRSKMILRLASLQIIKEFPVQSRGELHLKVPKKNKKDASQLLLELNLKISENNINQLES